jgi:hypothetical protein
MLRPLGGDLEHRAFFPNRGGEQIVRLLRAGPLPDQRR